MKKFVILSLAAAVLFGATSFANAQWGWYGSCRTCSNGQCSLSETTLPVESCSPCKPVESCSPCKPVESLEEKPSENADTTEPCKPVERYVPYKGKLIPESEYKPGRMYAESQTCEQTVIPKRESECRLLAAVNKARVRFGLAPCQMLPRLEARAKNISLANARWNSLFHSGSGTEIIACNSWGSEEHLVEQWLQSSRHRQYLLGNFRYIGAATSYNGSSVFGACQFSNCGEKSELHSECLTTSETSQQTCAKTCVPTDKQSVGQCRLNGNCRTCAQTRSCSYSKTCSRTYVRRGLFGWRRCCY